MEFLTWRKNTNPGFTDSMNFPRLPMTMDIQVLEIGVGEKLGRFKMAGPLQSKHEMNNVSNLRTPL